MTGKKEDLAESLKQLQKELIKKAQTTESISRDNAVRVADLMNCTDEEKIAERNKAFTDYKVWQARSKVYEEAELLLREVLR